MYFFSLSNDKPVRISCPFLLTPDFTFCIIKVHFNFTMSIIAKLNLTVKRKMKLSYIMEGKHMKFGQKIKDLRLGKGWTQEEMAQKLGKSKRTIIAYENGDTYPRHRSVYAQLSELFGVDINYLLTENEEFITNAAELYGHRGQVQAKDILEQTANLFAGGSLSADDELAFVNEVQRLYLDSKVRAKKFTPKRYLQRTPDNKE